MTAKRSAIRVMLIEDHKTMLWGLERLINEEQEGMQVVATARSCAEAQAWLPKCAPDIAVLDLDLDGESALAILPALVASGATKVLVFTGVRDPAILERAILLGARGVLNKDAPPEVLLKAISKIHAGELWIDHEMMSRVISELTRPPSTRKLDPEAAKQACLTSKERKIIHTIVAGNGAMNKSLAQSLFISEHTMRNHLVTIYKKLGVSNRLELYVYALKHHLDVPEAP